MELNPASIVNQNPVFFYSQLNDLKVQFNAHVGKAGGVHSSADSADVVFAANATDEGSSALLVNELRTAYSNHIKKGSIHAIADGTHILVIATLATDLPAAYARFIELQRVYNLHVANDYKDWHATPDTEDKTTLAAQLAPTYIR